MTGNYHLEPWQLFLGGVLTGSLLTLGGTAVGIMMVRRKIKITEFISEANSLKQSNGTRT